MSKQLLLIQQLNTKMNAYAVVEKAVQPPTGWIKSIRTALGMSMQQLGNRLSISKQSVLDMEEREKNGSITIKALKEAAKALDMKLVYGFVPVDGSLEKLIERKAKELAAQIVLRTNTNMKLEEQGNSQKRIDKAIKEMTSELKHAMPKTLWD